LLPLQERVTLALFKNVMISRGSVSCKKLLITE
jgi:hypothetical protein